MNLNRNTGAERESQYIVAKTRNSSPSISAFDVEPVVAVFCCVGRPDLSIQLALFTSPMCATDARKATNKTEFFLKT